MRDMWIILPSNDEKPMYWEGDRPKVWETEKSAQLEMLNDYLHKIHAHIDEFKDDAREFDAVDTELDEYVIACTVHDDGVITTEFHDPLYDPKTYVG